MKWNKPSSSPNKPATGQIAPHSSDDSADRLLDERYSQFQANINMNEVNNSRTNSSCTNYAGMESMDVNMSGNLNMGGDNTNMNMNMNSANMSNTSSINSYNKNQNAQLPNQLPTQQSQSTKSQFNPKQFFRKNNNGSNNNNNNNNNNFILHNNTPNSYNSTISFNNQNPALSMINDFGPSHKPTNSNASSSSNSNHSVTTANSQYSSSATIKSNSQLNIKQVKVKPTQITKEYKSMWKLKTYKNNVNDVEAQSKLIQNAKELAAESGNAHHFTKQGFRKLQTKPKKNKNGDVLGYVFVDVSPHSKENLKLNQKLNQIGNLNASMSNSSLTNMPKTSKMNPNNNFKITDNKTNKNSSNALLDNNQTDQGAIEVQPHSSSFEVSNQPVQQQPATSSGNRVTRLFRHKSVKKEKDLSFNSSSSTNLVETSNEHNNNSHGHEDNSSTSRKLKIFPPQLFSSTKVKKEESDSNSSYGDQFINHMDIDSDMTTNNQQRNLNESNLMDGIMNTNNSNNGNSTIKEETRSKSSSIRPSTLRRFYNRKDKSKHVNNSKLNVNTEIANNNKDNSDSAIETGDKASNSLITTISPVYDDHMELPENYFPSDQICPTLLSSTNPLQLSTTISHQTYNSLASSSSVNTPIEFSNSQSQFVSSTIDTPLSSAIPPTTERNRSLSSVSLMHSSLNTPKAAVFTPVLQVPSTLGSAVHTPTSSSTQSPKAFTTSTSATNNSNNNTTNPSTNNMMFNLNSEEELELASSATTYSSSGAPIKKMKTIKRSNSVVSVASSIASSVNVVNLNMNMSNPMAPAPAPANLARNSTSSNSSATNRNRSHSLTNYPTMNNSLGVVERNVMFPGTPLSPIRSSPPTRPPSVLPRETRSSRANSNITVFGASGAASGSGYNSNPGSVSGISGTNSGNGMGTFNTDNNSNMNVGLSDPIYFDAPPVPPGSSSFYHDSGSGDRKERDNDNQLDLYPDTNNHPDHLNIFDSSQGKSKDFEEIDFNPVFFQSQSQSQDTYIPDVGNYSGGRELTHDEFKSQYDQLIQQQEIRMFDEEDPGYEMEDPNFEDSNVVNNVMLNNIDNATINTQDNLHRGNQQQQQLDLESAQQAYANTQNFMNTVNANSYSQNRQASVAAPSSTQYPGLPPHHISISSLASKQSYNSDSSSFIQEGSNRQNSYDTNSTLFSANLPRTRTHDSSISSATPSVSYLDTQKFGYQQVQPQQQLQLTKSPGQLQLQSQVQSIPKPHRTNSTSSPRR